MNDSADKIQKNSFFSRELYSFVFIIFMIVKISANYYDNY